MTQVTNREMVLLAGLSAFEKKVTDTVGPENAAAFGLAFGVRLAAIDIDRAMEMGVAVDKALQHGGRPSSADLDPQGFIDASHAVLAEMEPLFDLLRPDGFVEVPSKA